MFIADYRLRSKFRVQVFVRWGCRRLSTLTLKTLDTSRIWRNLQKPASQKAMTSSQVARGFGVEHVLLYISMVMHAICSI